MSYDQSVIISMDRIRDQQTHLKAFLSESERTYEEEAAFEQFVHAAEHLLSLPNYRGFLEKFTQEHHCVRCHDAFSDAENGPGECLILHTFHQNSGEDKHWPHTDKYGNFEEYKTVFTAECCGKELEVSGDNEPEEPSDGCFEGWHTTDPRMVKTNGVNIVACVEQGGKCVVKIECGDLF